MFIMRKIFIFVFVSLIHCLSFALLFPLYSFCFTYFNYPTDHFFRMETQRSYMVTLLQFINMVKLIILGSLENINKSELLLLKNNEVHFNIFNI